MRVYLDAYRSRRIFDGSRTKTCQTIGCIGAPSGLYQEAMESVDILDSSRSSILDILGADGELIFTSGGSEANNLAIMGAGEANPGGKHMIVTAIEQPSILAPAKDMEKKGFTVDFIGVDDNGMIDLDAFSEILSDETSLVSVQMVNHEVGVLQPISEVIDIVRDRTEAVIHSDATFAVGRLPVDLGRLDIDLVTMSSHRISGPMGAGAVWAREDVKIAPQIKGDTSYNRLRGGTENIPSISGMSVALETMASARDDIWGSTSSLRERLVKGVSGMNDIRINSPEHVPAAPPAPGSTTGPVGMSDIANITFNYAEGEAITLYLDMEGIAVSTGSACASWNLQANYVLTAMGRSHEEAHGSLRFSFDERNTADEIDIVIEKLDEIVSRLRGMSAFKPGK